MVPLSAECGGRLVMDWLLRVFFFFLRGLQLTWLHQGSSRQSRACFSEQIQTQMTVLSITNGELSSTSANWENRLVLSQIITWNKLCSECEVEHYFNLGPPKNNTQPWHDIRKKLYYITSKYDDSHLIPDQIVLLSCFILSWFWYFLSLYLLPVSVWNVLCTCVVLFTFAFSSTVPSDV